MLISVCPVYTLIQPGELKNSTALVIDTLRMTSTAAVALQNGSAGLKVVGEVEQARILSQRCDALLGGERHALKIDGFDFSNSPLEYRSEIVAGKRIVMTTTNGTRAIRASLDADEVYLGCMMNASAAAEALKSNERICIVLAGTLGRFSLEDAVTAGAVISRMDPSRIDLDDMAQAAYALYNQGRANMKAFLSTTKHYQNLMKLGFERDIDLCLSEDVLSCVPKLGEDEWFHSCCF